MPVQTFSDPDATHNPGANIAPPAWFTVHESNGRSLRSRPGAQIRSSGSQSFTPGVTAQVTMGTVVFDVGPFTGTANQLTIPSGWGGKYDITAQVRVDTGAGGPHFSIIEVQVNNTTSILRKLTHATGAGAVFDNTLSGSIVWPLVATDNLRIYVLCDAGTSTPATQVGNVQATLSCMWESP